MTIQIKHKLTGEVLYSSERDTMRGAVLEAVEKRANLRSADLRYADLRSANLRSANLSYADLSSADLRYADLRSANLRSANLSSADLRSADLRSADLRSANLSYANLSYANLRSADLRYADLRSANLRSANLSYANLRYANLRYADLRYAENITTAHFQYSYGGNSVAQQLQVGAYQLTIIEDTLWGGCTKMKLTEWLEYDGEELRESDKNYLEYVTKPFILMVMCQRELGGE